MSNSVKYSYCTTIYNSVETVESFYQYVSKSLNDNSELIIVDAFSKDGTYEKLLEIEKKDTRVKIIRKKCLRGKGRQLAIDNSSGEIIVMLDTDIKYYALDKYIGGYVDRHEKKLLVYDVRIGQYNVGFVIGRREIFNFLGGYPNLNNSEDHYLYKVADKFNLLERRTIEEGDVSPISVRNLPSGNERRYGLNELERILRRVVATRDALFVHNYKAEELNKLYRLEGFRRYTVGYTQYILGKLLRVTIKDETVEDRVKRISTSMKTR